GDAVHRAAVFFKYGEDASIGIGLGLEGGFGWPGSGCTAAAPCATASTSAAAGVLVLRQLRLVEHAQHVLGILCLGGGDGGLITGIREFLGGLRGEGVDFGLLVI